MCAYVYTNNTVREWQKVMTRVALVRNSEKLSDLTIPWRMVNFRKWEVKTFDPDIFNGYPI